MHGSKNDQPLSLIFDTLIASNNCMVNVSCSWDGLVACTWQVVLSCESGGASALEVPAWHVVPGRYLLQLSLAAEPLRQQPGHASPAGSAPQACASAAGRGSAGAREGACEPRRVAWRVYVAPSADAKACSLVEDDSFARYLQVRRQPRAHRAVQETSRSSTSRKISSRRRSYAHRLRRHMRSEVLHRISRGNLLDNSG